MAGQKRNRRAGVEDRWTRSDGLPSARHGKGMRWMGRYVASDGRERTKSFARKKDAQHWIEAQIGTQHVGTWTVPELAAQTFGEVSEKWIATKANRKPKTVAGYRSILETVALGYDSLKRPRLDG